MAAQSVDVPQRIPLVIEPENRGESTAYDARLVNAYMETKGQNEHWIYERPGMDEHSRPPAGNAAGRGVFQWRGDLYSIFGDTVYKNGSPVSGTVDTTNGVYRFDSCLGATPKLQLGNGVNAYNYDSGSGLVQITDAQFPAAFCKGWAYLNGTTYVGMSTAHLLGSDINDPVNWDPLNDILAYIEPDMGVAVGKQLVYVVFFKQWSTEIFYDAGNSSASPLGRVEGAKVNWGSLSENSHQELDGMQFWLGKTRYGSPEVVMLDNLKAEAISSKAVERLINAADYTTETVYSWTVKLDGHRFYVLTLKNLNLTLAFDVDERRWCQWTDTNGNYMPIVSSTTDSQLRNILQHESNGRLYVFDSSYADDDGDPIQVDIYTSNMDGGTKVIKQQEQFEMVADQVQGSVLQIRWNDKDFDPASWTNFRSIDLSKERPLIPDLGSFSRRAFNLRHRCPVRMPRLIAFEMRQDLGKL